MSPSPRIGTSNHIVWRCQVLPRWSVVQIVLLRTLQSLIRYQAEQPYLARILQDELMKVRIDGRGMVRKGSGLCRIAYYSC